MFIAERMSLGLNFELLSTVTEAAKLSEGANVF